jgi:phosphoglycerate kinase
MDVAVGTSFDKSSDRRDIATDTVGGQDMILDFGPRSTEEVLDNLKNSKMIIWNGPLGVIELEKFKTSTEEIARFIADNKLSCVVGGGDSAGFIHNLGLVDKFTHVSTGGGASLELMSGKKLPGVEALMDKT